MPNHADQLRTIRTFEDLVRYLEDELDWPLQEYGFDELTFEYSPAELGLKDEDAAKVKTIHQLRPVVHGQPFGIFFVEFERKRMPVVVLRRILSHLVLKKRASANLAGAAAWNLDDLLFISAFGDEASDQREIAFAHFHQEAGDLPTLRVLGWDGADTGLKLDYVAHVLHERLCWPEDPADADAWREQWSRAFRHRLGHVIRTSDALAERLAGLARGIRGAALTLMDHESDRGSLRQLHKAFKTALIHDLTEADFADTYAQTVTYGLLTAAISSTDMTGGRYGTALYAGRITEMVPITNPFLKEMLGAFLQAGGQQGGINFDELGVQDVVELLRGDETDLPAILRDFGNKTQGEDPVIHFYEHFLAAYDKKLKVQRGIFYTPQPVVSYIVRSVHELLQTEFGLEDGLASTVTWGEMRQTFEASKTSKVFTIPEDTDPNAPFVVILDPATGTATFLVEVIDVIHKTLTAKWQAQGLSEAQRRDAWNAYVPDHLLPRLHGYELMMAPYAIAHMKIGLKLHETGYRFGSVERVRVYLTNALEPASDERQQLAFAGWTPALAHEAQAVNAIKRWQRFTVVVGNPPYAYASANVGAWVSQLVAEYSRVDGILIDERNPRGLQDDYVKFFGLAQYLIESAGAGVLGFITNHGYLSNPTFRGMRQSLVKSFSSLYTYDLHGNAKREERALDGSKDENVFDIMQGVAISLGFRKRWNIADQGRVFRADVFGSRMKKYNELSQSGLTTQGWNRIAPSSPFYLFVTHQETLETEYNTGIPITRVFRIGSVGISTSRDNLCIEFTSTGMFTKANEFASMPPEVARDMFGLGSDVAEWNIKLAQNDLVDSGIQKTLVYPILYRPFDIRYTYYTGRSRGFHSRPRPEVMRHLLSGTNLALCSNRQVNNEFRHVFATRHMADGNSVSLATRERTYEFPLHLSTQRLSETQMSLEVENQCLNMDSEFLRSFESKLDRMPDLVLKPVLHATPEDIFHYIYAIFHSPTYRARYAEFLKIDFPRVPLTNSLDLFRGLAALGGELVALHLLEDDYPGAAWNRPEVGAGLAPAQGDRREGDRKGSPLQRHITTWAGPAAPEVEKVTYADNTVWVNKAQTAGFRGVPEAVWNFHIGGYQVCEKWLKDRKGRTLSAEDIEHYQRVVVSLNETIRIMGEIDAVIEAHGGWPIQ